MLFRSRTAWKSTTPSRRRRVDGVNALISTQVLGRKAQRAEARADEQKQRADAAEAKSRTAEASTDQLRADRAAAQEERVREGGKGDGGRDWRQERREARGTRGAPEAHNPRACI